MRPSLRGRRSYHGAIVADAEPGNAGRRGEADLITASGGPAGPGVAERDLAALDLAGLDWWRARVGWVPQQPTLFPGTVADNIRVGWPQAPEDAVREAARAAALDDVPLDRRLGDLGAGLSAGQRRRVALARAHLDEDTAAELTRDLLTATEGKTVLLITHRPVEPGSVDQVLRLG